MAKSVKEPTLDINLFVLTWNVAASTSAIDDLPSIFSQFPDDADLIVCAFQELNAEFIFSHITKKLDAIARELGFVRISETWLTAVRDAQSVITYACKRLVPFIHDVESDTRLVSDLRLTSKGGVCQHFWLNGVDFSLCGAHLSAHDSNALDRVRDFNEIVTGISFGGVKKDNMLASDVIIWAGDLNFRIDNVERALVLDMVSEAWTSALLENDQLLTLMNDGVIFLGFNEGDITFPPTYKFDIGTNRYDTSSKLRTPAYTDRILYSDQAGVNPDLASVLRLERYWSLGEVCSSDHKPVLAHFRVTLPEVPLTPVDFTPQLTVRIGVNIIGTYSFDRRYQASGWDWIGIYADNFVSLAEHKAYIYAPTQTVEVTAPSLPKQNRCLYAYEIRASLLREPGLYRLVYVSRLASCVYGMTPPFRILGSN